MQKSVCALELKTHYPVLLYAFLFFFFYSHLSLPFLHPGRFPLSLIIQVETSQIWGFDWKNFMASHMATVKTVRYICKLALIMHHLQHMSYKYSESGRTYT